MGGVIRSLESKWRGEDGLKIGDELRTKLSGTKGSTVGILSPSSLSESSLCREENKTKSEKQRG